MQKRVVSEMLENLRSVKGWIIGTLLFVFLLAGGLIALSQYSSVDAPFVYTHN